MNVYICGKAGLGKTSSVLRSLREFHKMFPTVSFYSKLAGLTCRKWWDGYDNQPIVCIDDPELFNTKYNMEDVQAFKGIVSEEPYWSKLRRAACSLLCTLSSSPATTHTMCSVRVEEMAAKYTPYGTELRVHVPHTKEDYSFQIVDTPGQYLSKRPSGLSGKLLGTTK